MSRNDKRIRVLHLIDSLELGGAQTVLLGLLQFHDRARFEVHLASMHGTPNSLFYDRARQLDIPVVLLSPRRWLPLYLFRLPLQLLRFRYDVVHCHLYASNWLGKPLARLLGATVIISQDQCNDVLRSDLAMVRFVDRFANRFADRIFAVSATIRDYLIAYEEIAPEKIRVIANSLAERSVVEGKKSFGKMIGGAGRLVAQKNFDRFLRIARALQEIDPSYQFVVAGSGPLASPLQTRAKSLGVRVDWLGVQPSLDRFFGLIDLYLLTSDFEGLPMTVLEALQHGVPVAAMAVDGIREEFTNEIALLAPADSDHEIGHRIHALLQDQAELSAQIQRGMELVSRRFSARTHVREMEQIYLELLEQKRARKGEK